MNNDIVYLNALKDVLENGEKRVTRNSVTLSKFGVKMDFDIKDKFPLLTTKKMFWKGIVEELLFFIRGETDSNKLSAQGVKIWEPNTSKEFLDSVGLPWEPGCMGPMYGYQWRHFNKPYPSNDNDNNKNENSLFTIDEDLPALSLDADET